MPKCPCKSNPKRLMSVREVAQAVGCDPSTVYRMLYAGELRGLRLGKEGSYRFEWESVIRQLEDLGAK